MAEQELSLWFQTILIGEVQKVSDEVVIVNLLTIYDKSAVENISDKELKELIKNEMTK